MTKDDFINNCTVRLNTLPRVKVEQSIEVILEAIVNTLIDNGRVEIRGFGSFKVTMQKAWTARNPKTGVTAYVEEKRKIHFKPGQKLRQCVNGDNYVR